jgi:agmatinase
MNNHACSARRVYEDGFTDLIIIGGRSGTAEQFEFARNNLRLFTADKVKEQGTGSILSEVKKLIAKKRVYFSIDADVIDCCLTPGLGTPEPLGLTPFDIRDIVTAIAPHSVAFDYVEVCPQYDHGQAAAVAGQMVREFIAANWASQKPD